MASRPKDDEREPEVYRQFSQLITNQRSGKTHAELTEACTEALERARATGKKATVTLKLTFDPHSAESRHIIVSDEVTVKLPEFPRDPSLFYATDENYLSPENPDQPKLPLQSVPAPDAKDAKRVEGAS